MNSQILNHDARPSTLLVVDDDQALRDLVRVKMMKRGYKVFTASDGLTAFELLEANWVDLILLDQNMPESEGLEVFREMRIRWPQLPVVMVTAHGSKHLIKDFLLSGGRDFMEKPIVDFQAFDFRIKRVLLEVARERTAGKALREAIAREESQKAVNVLLTSMSHEIRTPLNSVQTMAYLLGQCGLPGKQNEYVTTISKAVRDLLSLLDNILDFSSVEVGEFALDKKSFNLEDLLRNTYESFSERLGLKGLSFTARIAPEVPIFLIGDPRSLGQTLVSLIDNAIKFTEHGGVEVSVTLLKAERERLSLEFSVTDTGIGMTRLECEKIFNPFTQLDSSNTRSYGGVGIGLALCKKIVELMGGGIEVESQPGRGSVFRFSLDLEPDPFQRSQGEYAKRYEILIGSPVDGEKHGLEVGSDESQSETGEQKIAPSLLDDLAVMLKMHDTRAGEIMESIIATGYPRNGKKEYEKLAEAISNFEFDLGLEILKTIAQKQGFSLSEP